MTVALRDGLRVMVRYNRWMNERLYDCCARLTDAEHKADRKAFSSRSTAPSTTCCSVTDCGYRASSRAHSGSARSPKSSIPISPTCAASARRPTLRSWSGPGA
jgi:hypothetical protein